MCGIPGSGKSTLAARMEGYRISTDELRETFLKDPAIVDHDVLIFSVARAAARYFLKRRETVIIDATNLRRSKRALFIRIAQKNNVPVKLVLVDCPLELAIKRNAGRDRRVPPPILKALFKSYEPPALEEGIDIIEIRDPDMNITETINAGTESYPAK